MKRPAKREPGRVLNLIALAAGFAVALFLGALVRLGG